MIWKNKYIPFKGFKAMAIWPIIFVRKDKAITDIDLNHERIHFRQQIELLLIGFYVVYLLEFLLKWYLLKDKKQAYKNISFEKEAYNNEADKNYLTNRKLFGQWRQ